MNKKRWRYFKHEGVVVLREHKKRHLKQVLLTNGKWRTYKKRTSESKQSEISVFISTTSQPLQNFVKSSLTKSEIAVLEMRDLLLKG